MKATVVVIGLAVAAAIASARTSAERSSLLQAPSQQPPTAVVAGRVIDTSSGRPIADVVVTLAGVRQAPRPVITDARGRFVFAGLTGGTISLSATRVGYVSASPIARAFPVKAGERLTDLTIRLSPLSSISGTVRDDAGDPVVGVEVIAFRRAIVNGRPELRRAGQVATDDRGAYRIFNVRPGEVLVCACRRDPIPFDGVLLKTLASQPLHLLGAAARAVKLGAGAVVLDDTLRTFAPTFYPSSPTTTNASRVTLAPGDDRAGVDISLVPVRAARVSGTIVGAPGPMHAAFIRLIPTGDRLVSAIAELSPALVQPDGRFDFTAVPPGEYTLHVTYSETKGAGGPSGAALAFIGSRGTALASPGVSVPGSPQFSAAEPVVVADDDVVGITVTLREGPRVSGRVEFAGNSPPPSPQAIESRGIVRLEFLTEPPVFTGWIPLGRVGGDGSFSFPGLPGRHLLTASAGAPWTNLKSITIAGVDATDLPIDLDRDVGDVVVTLSDVPLASLSGTVRHTGTTREDETALVFPVDRRFWDEPAAAYRRFRTTAVRRDGSFLTRLPAGEYFVAVVPDDRALDWQERRRLEQLAKSAVRVQLADGEKKTIEVVR
jgi:hypothetical protein